MPEIETLLLEPLTEEEIMPMTEIMKRAFDHDTKIHLGEEKGGPEGYDNGDFLRKWAFNSPTEPFRVLLNGKLIGCVILWIRESGRNYLGMICIDPSVQGRGIGTKIWREVESRYPDTKVWMTDTPGFAKRNHHYYVNKLGFRVIRVDHPGDIRKESYTLEKDMRE